MIFVSPKGGSMINIPTLTPLFDYGEKIFTEIKYENKFTTMDDVTHDEEHIHDFYEIYINLRGDVSFLVEDGLYSIARGDMIITRPNEIHRCIYHSDCVHEHFCVWIKDFPLATRMLSRVCEKSSLLILSEEEKQRLIDLCFDFYQSHNRGEPLCFRAAGSFFAILDLICNNRKHAAAAQSLPASFSDIVEYISKHYFEPSCTVSLICDNFYISKSTLCRRFRGYFQTTPSDYIESKRFSEAKKLLRSGQSVQDACFNSGFSDCSYFIMRFRKKFGVTPYKYQKDFI